MATTSLQGFFKSAGHKLRDDYIVHFNCAKLVLSPCISMSTYAKPLAFDLCLLLFLVHTSSLYH